MRLAVGIASAGRALQLSTVVRDMEKQQRLPDLIVIAVPDEADVDVEQISRARIPTKIIVCERGLTKQRNVILGVTQSFDFVIFVDDDFVVHSSYIAEMEKALNANPSVVVATGNCIADGASGESIALEDARRLLSMSVPGVPAIEDVFSAYGCNMTVATWLYTSRKMTFDERLPAYGWLEDLDYSRRAAHVGRVVRIGTAVGVHLAARSARQSGRRYGYSQIANPLHLYSKGSIDVKTVLSHAGRNLLGNCIHTASFNRKFDYGGRLIGNLIALRDLFRGRVDPLGITQLG